MVAVLHVGVALAVREKQMVTIPSKRARTTFFIVFAPVLEGPNRRLVNLDFLFRSQRFDFQSRSSVEEDGRGLNPWRQYQSQIDRREIITLLIGTRSGSSATRIVDETTKTVRNVATLGLRIPEVQSAVDRERNYR